MANFQFGEASTPVDQSLIRAPVGYKQVLFALLPNFENVLGEWLERQQEIATSFVKAHLAFEGMAIFLKESNRMPALDDRVRTTDEFFRSMIGEEVSIGELVLGMEQERRERQEQEIGRVQGTVSEFERLLQLAHFQLARELMLADLDGKETTDGLFFQ